MMIKKIVCLLSACAALSAVAQTVEPTTEQMIQQLKAPRTRSLRNLTLEAVIKPPGAEDVKTDAATPAATAAPAPQQRPSLSLLIQFDFNSARVSPQSQQSLANLAQALQSPELQGSSFAVEGHTDAKGSADYNQKLSQQRAMAVRDLLKTKGVVESRLQAAGKGSSELANSDQPFAAENRRVRIVNLD